MADEEDPFGRLRRKQREREPADPDVDTGRSYQAFSPQDKVLRLDIRRSSGASHAPAYSYLLNIIYGRRFYTSFVLVYNFMTVTVKGKNLADVVTSILLNKCASICEFHPELFDLPEPDAPLIERIDISGPQDRMDAMNEADSLSKDSSLPR